jgi:DNA polymerase-3 subunit gamma/tau
MSYQVTARKWRPMVFDDVIGQTHVSDTLRNALAQNRLAHAFIFSGTRGCGKTTTARILARAVNCLNPKNFEPCNECEVCKEIIDGRSLDVIEIDGASNRGVDEIRNLRESVRYAPTRGKKKVYIIDEVHMLTKEAFNALLKTLEEPPPHVLFIFATTELHKVPATILSRCQRYDFRRIGLEEIVARLKFIAGQENVTIDDDSLLIIGKKGDGSMRDAQSIFDQVISFCGMTITAKQVGDALNIVDQELFFRVSDILRNKDTKAALDLVQEVVKSGYDIKEFVSGLTEHFRNMLIVKTTNSTHLIEESEVHRKRYAADSPAFVLNDLLRFIKVATDTENSFRFTSQPRFKLEVMMVQLTKMEQSVKIDELLSQIDEVKKKLHSEGNFSNGLNSFSRQPSIAVESKEVFEPAAEYTSSPVVRPVPTPPSPNVVAPKPKFAVQENQPRYTFVAPVKKVEEEQKKEASGAPQNSNISLSEIQQQWNTIVDEMRKKKISVGTILGETSPLDLVNGTLRIACGDDFHQGTLFRNKEILAETINTIVNARIRIEPILHEGGLPPKENHHPAETKQPSIETPSKPLPSIDDHPLVKKLYSDFGAERV